MSRLQMAWRYFKNFYKGFLLIHWYFKAHFLHICVEGVHKWHHTRRNEVLVTKIDICDNFYDITWVKNGRKRGAHEFGKLVTSFMNDPSGKVKFLKSIFFDTKLVIELVFGTNRIFILRFFSFVNWLHFVFSELFFLKNVFIV